MLSYPTVRRETIDLENPHLEMWRLRRATPEIIEGILKLANDMIGYRYDLANYGHTGDEGTDSKLQHWSQRRQGADGKRAETGIKLHGKLQSNRLIA